MIIAVIKLHGTDPTGDEEEGKMARSSLYSFLCWKLWVHRAGCGLQTLTNEVITFM